MWGKVALLPDVFGKAFLLKHALQLKQLVRVCGYCLDICDTLKELSVRTFSAHNTTDIPNSSDLM